MVTAKSRGEKFRIMPDARLGAMALERWLSDLDDAELVELIAYMRIEHKCHHSWLNEALKQLLIAEQQFTPTQGVELHHRVRLGECAAAIYAQRMGWVEFTQRLNLDCVPSRICQATPFGRMMKKVIGSTSQLTAMVKD